MADIIRDLADPLLATTVREYLLDVIMPKVGGKDYRISETALSLHLLRCRACHAKAMALVFENQALAGGLVTNYEAGENHLVLNPGARLTIGIHPEKGEELEKQLGMKIPFAQSRSFYECAACRGLRLPEHVCEESGFFTASLIKRRFGCDPIIDMREYNSSLGCFITVTEFPLNGRLGRFMNLQINFNEFIWILNRMGLVDGRVLQPFLKRFPSDIA